MVSSSNIFQHYLAFTIGIEEEYMLCHPESGELIDKANDIMNNIKIDLKDRYSYELILSEIEVNTSICRSVDETMNEISYLRMQILKMQ